MGGSCPAAFRWAATAARSVDAPRPILAVKLLGLIQNASIAIVVIMSTGNMVFKNDESGNLSISIEKTSLENVVLSEY